MRAFCTVSAPLEVCASTAEQLSPGSRFLALRLLSHQQQQPKTLYFLVDAKSRVREVYTQTCLHFATQGMLDTELFGLAVLIDGEYMFADPESKLSKYGPKSWRSSHTHGLDANGRPLLELHFRVQFYIESPLMLKDETSRHNYYLQLRHNVLQRELPRADQSDQALVFLAGLALQADLGDAPAMEDVVGGVRGGLTEAEHLANATTTTLPKISKRLSSANERMLRLSTYVASTSANGNSSSVTTTSNKRDKERNLATSNADYFRIEDYLPLSLHTAWARSALRACHREHQGLDSAKAELLYIQQACSLHETINAHTFRMRLLKSEQGAGSSWFVVYAKGVKILGGGQSQTDASTSSSSAATSCAATFLWPNITKLSFERKKFEIRSGESRIILYSTSDEKNKLLLTLCKDTHQWSMKLAARLKEVSKRKEEEEAESQRLHASYACSRSLLMPYKSKNEQRISVISSTSSNTTSGIVSDRVHSEDELEIMINTPPAPLAAPSTESLALAHLLDRDRPSSVSRQTSSVGQMSIEEQQRTNDSSTTEASAIATTTMTTTTPSPTLATAAADPAVSQQEYLDAKQGSLLAAMAAAAPPPPTRHPYLAMQMSPAIYRSTPYLPLALSTHSRYASTQNLSDTYVQLPGTATYSPLYSPSMASLCSSYEPPPPPAPTHPTTQMHPHTHSAIGVNAASASLHFSRSRSDDNILNSLDSMPINKQGKRLPPPPPPPYVNRRLKKPPMPMPSEKPPPIPLKPLTSSSMLVPRKPPTLNPHHANSPITKTSSGAQWAGERPKTNNFVLGLNGGGSSGGGSNGSGRNCNSILAQLQASMAAQSEAQALDIALLREKSKHLDLPLISALCNDPSLLKQTKLKVTTTGNGSPGTGLGEATNNSSTMTTATSTTTTTMTTTPTTRSSSPPLPRKNPSISSHHRHPQDKLPPLPVQQLAEANNYVMDPAAVLMNNKQQHHKSYNSQT
ncbi:protein expanded isoform X2 [Drosophila tropicalis]|uniref:protein expanded isoform X2 n=1 Tax=Drosophila tropicalis TaxID=46794 RepID=UPI0035ABFCCB